MTRRQPMVYIAQCGEGGPVKIGWSYLPQTRVRNLGYDSAFPVKLLRSFPGDLFAERRMHKKFRNLKIGGEWFWFSEDMMNYTPRSGKPRLK